MAADEPEKRPKKQWGEAQELIQKHGVVGQNTKDLEGCVDAAVCQLAPSTPPNAAPAVLQASAGELQRRAVRDLIQATKELHEVTETLRKESAGSSKRQGLLACLALVVSLVALFFAGLDCFGDADWQRQQLEKLTEIAEAAKSANRKP